MAISKLEVGVVPLGIGGDSLRSAAAKVNANFSDTTHAASKLVGTEAGNVMEVGAFGVGLTNDTRSLPDHKTSMNRLLGTGLSAEFVAHDELTRGTGSAINLVTYSRGTFGAGGVSHAQGRIILHDNGKRLSLQGVSGTGDLYIMHHTYTTGNTTKDANGFLKGASPIVKVFADKVELNDDAVDQNVTYNKNGIGDYTITTVSGLSTDGWYIELPKDINGNPKVAVTLNEVDGVINLKTYKRIFSMETFTFEPDLDNPLDIPDTRWIDLRLNEIPFEIEDATNEEV